MKRALDVLHRAGKCFSQEAGPFLAQGIAFNLLFAIFPLLMLVFAVFGFIYGGDQGQLRVATLIAGLAPSIQPMLLENAQHVVAFRGISSIVALVALAWSGKNLFQGLAFTLDRSLGIEERRPLLIDVLVALVALPVIGTVLLLATGVPLAISYIVALGDFSGGGLWTQAAGYAAGILLVFVVAMLLYTFLPSRRPGPWFGLPGALVTTVAWEISQIAFAIYSTHVDYRHVYGALATVAVLLLWFYYMAYIFLFGAHVSAQAAKA